TRNTSAVRMQSRPLRLWSTVLSEPVIFPGARTAGMGSTRTATRTSALLEVGNERLDLVVAPVLADGRHSGAAVPHEAGQPVEVREARVARGIRADEDALLLLDVVALRAAADRDLLPECRRARVERLPLGAPPPVVLVARFGDGPGAHRSM